MAMPSEQVVLDFSDEEGGLQGKVIWSQDSKWFAYAVKLSQRVTETRVCHRSGDRFAAWFGAEISSAVNANAYGLSFHVALSDYEHGVNLYLLGALNFAVDIVGAVVEFCADLLTAQLLQNRSRVIH